MVKRDLARDRAFDFYRFKLFADFCALYDPNQTRRFCGRKTFAMSEDRHRKFLGKRKGCALG